MKHKTSIFAALLLIVAFSLIYIDVNNKQDVVLREMVALDRVYIPVLAFTSQDKLEASRKSMKRLVQGWDDFKTNTLDMHKLDPLWDEDMDKVENYIRVAEDIVHQGVSIKSAHDELEHIRNVMLHVRERNDMDYFPDYLTRFHESMEAIVLTVKGKTSEQLTDAQVNEIKLEVEKAYLLWQDVISAKLEPKLFGFSPQQMIQIEKLKLDELRAIEELQRALVSGDNDNIISYGVAIKPVFAKLFMMFGDFSPAT